MRQRWSVGIVLPAIVLVTTASLAAPKVTINARGTATKFSPGVRGLAAPSVQIQWPVYTIAFKETLAVARGTSIRGVAGGLEADIFDWRDRNDQPREGTLEFLRAARDLNADLVITANIRGLVEPDPAVPDKRRYSDTSAETLTALAADWVRYTNHIVRSYRQGDEITNVRDRAILDSLVWSSGAPGDNWDKLLKPGEAMPPKVTYWEIGNEPRIGLQNAYGITNAYTFLAPSRKDKAKENHKLDYHVRYASMAQAMKAEDPNIKVGPCIVSAASVTERELLLTLLQRQPNGRYLPVDFISYHPYEDLHKQETPEAIEAYLGKVHETQAGFKQRLIEIIRECGRDPDSIELMASEVNVSDWSSNDTPREAQMAHALGTVETVFTHARLGLVASHYWVFPSHSVHGTKYPLYKAYEALRDHMGDELLQAYGEGSTRVYATRNSRTGAVAVWGLNFSNSDEASIDLTIRGADPKSPATLHTLEDITGAATTLFSSNLAPDMPGGPTNNVDWTGTEVKPEELPAYRYTLPAATISVLVFHQVGDPR